MMLTVAYNVFTTGLEHILGFTISYDFVILHAENYPKVSGRRHFSFLLLYSVSQDLVKLGWPCLPWPDWQGEMNGYI
jgi:hypothetical protein